MAYFSLISPGFRIPSILFAQDVDSITSQSGGLFAV
jgi:hypothetical protein